MLLKKYVIINIEKCKILSDFIILLNYVKQKST